jgi:hypothetical protein
MSPRLRVFCFHAIFLRPRGQTPPCSITDRPTLSRCRLGNGDRCRCHGRCPLVGLGGPKSRRFQELRSPTTGQSANCPVGPAAVIVECVILDRVQYKCIAPARFAHTPLKLGKDGLPCPRKFCTHPRACPRQNGLRSACKFCTHIALTHAVDQTIHRVLWREKLGDCLIAMRLKLVRIVRWFRSVSGS